MQAMLDAFGCLMWSPLIELIDEEVDQNAVGRLR